MHPFLTSLIIAFGTVLGTLAIGLPLAIILVKTDFPAKKYLQYLYLTPIFIPPAIMALAWMSIIGQAECIYSALGAIIVLTLCYFPFMTLISSAGISMIGKDIEYAAWLEYGVLGVIRYIIIPYASKYIIAASLFVFVLAISNYEIPALLGIHTYPVEIFSVFSVEYDHARAIWLSLPLILFCAGLIIYAGWLMKDKDFITVSHDWQGLGKFTLTKFQKKFCAAFVIALLLLAVVLPIGILALKAGGTLAYTKAFSLITSELSFTLVWAVSGALIITFASFIIAYFIEHARSPWKQILYYSSILPFALPATVLGIILIKIFNWPILNFIYTTPLILLIGYFLRFAPFSIRIISAAMEHMDKSMEEEAILAGARLRDKLFKITAPNCWQAMVAGFAISLVLIIGELGMTVLVVPPGASPFILKIYNLMHYGANKLVSAQALILVGLMGLLAGGIFVLYKKIKKVLFGLVIFATIGLCANAYCAETKHLYSTWDSLEADTISSAWLIKNFIDKDVVFKIYHKGELIEEGIPFDVPEAKYQRKQNESTFESLVRMNNIHDPRVSRLSKIIHDIEINYWGKRMTPETNKVQQDISNMITANKDPAVCLQKGIEYFADFYKNIMRSG